MINLGSFLKKWIFRFSRFSIIGSAVWLVNTVMYFVLFQFFGIYTWFITLFTGVMEFALITFFNKKVKGNMFDRPKSLPCVFNDDQNRT